MKTRELTVVALFAAIIVVLAAIPPIPLPFSPVPITLQTLGVFLCAALLGAKLGALSVLIYVLLGALGLPVFSGGAGGIGVIAGPTGGYLIGFIIGAFASGYLIEKSKEKHLVYDVGAMLIGLAFIYLIGTVHLAVNLDIDFVKALKIGSLPYIPLDLIKMGIAVALARPVRRRLKVQLNGAQ